MVNKKMAKLTQNNAATAAAAAQNPTIQKTKRKSSEKISMQIAKMNGHKRSIFEQDTHREVEFDPFKKTGCPFGSLAKEVEYRYSKYLSDIYDGLNLHCFIAIIFGFTVCFAPALCFGGILGL